MSKKLRFLSCAIATCAALAQATPGGPAATSVPFAPNGDAVDGTSGQPVALSPTSLLVAAEGADGTAGTADDVTLLVTGLGSAPAVKAIATKHASTYSSRIARLSSARAAMVSSGDDGTFGTADDALLVLDRLGSEDSVTEVVVVGLGDNQQFTPERLTSDLFVVPALGADLTADTADDEVAVVSTAASPPSVTRFPAPYQRSGGRTRVVALSPSSFLVASDGPNKKNSDADDVVYLFRADGDSFTRTDLAAPGLNRRAAGRCVRLSSTEALVVSAGVDFKDSTADDEVLLLDAAAGTVTHIAVPFAKNGSGGQVSVLGPTLAVIGTMGADGVAGTADDAVAVLSGLGATNTVTTVVVGATADNNECRPVRLDASTFALATLGSDRVISTADDEVTIVRLGVTALVQHVVVGSLAAGTTSTLVPVSRSALLLAGGGPDQVVGNAYDAVIVLSGIGSTLSVTLVPISGALDSLDAFRFVPELLGGGRAALLSSGADNDLGAGGDDAVRVIEGLDAGQVLDVLRLKVTFARQRPSKPARVTVEAGLVLEDPASLLTEDLTVSIGNVSQTIAAGGLVSVKNGRFLQYADSAGTHGPVRSLSFDTLKRTLRISAEGADQDLATTAPGYVPVGIDVGGVLVPQSVSARPGRNGFAFRKKRTRA